MPNPKIKKEDQCQQAKHVDKKNRSKMKKNQPINALRIN